MTFQQYLEAGEVGVEEAVEIILDAQVDEAQLAAGGNVTLPDLELPPQISSSGKRLGLRLTVGDWPLAASGGSAPAPAPAPAPTT